MISILALGTIDYTTGLRLQEQLVGLRKEGRIGDTLLLLEHTPVITLGRNAHSTNILASPETLAQRGVEVFECNRGGDVTFHGPGQLVAYPILDLHGFPSRSLNRSTMGVIEFVRNLEEVLIRTCAEFEVPTKRIAGLTGVWTTESLEQPGHSAESKIAALGVHVSRGITSHGIALNVNTDLACFNLIIPCGISSKPVTSISKELRHTVPLQDVARVLARHFGHVFNSQILCLESIEALLGNSFGVPVRPPENLRKIHREDDNAWA